MRRTRDRIRHAILFEFVALIFVTPFGGTIFHIPMGAFGVVVIVSTTIAMLWNYGFNLAFDHALIRIYNTTLKTFPLRIMHASLFEIGLLALLVPFIAWQLDVSLWQAFVIDVSLAGFYVLYAFVFNWAYDVAFPAPNGGCSS